MFTKASERSAEEIELRKNRGLSTLKFGVSFLDEALRGIIKSDLILIGAPSGVGKTALCCNIALANIADGKRIHYVALEAEKCEIEARIKYQIIAGFFFKDPNRPSINNFCFADWYLGKYLSQMVTYENMTHEFFQTAFPKLFTFYKGEKFDIENFIESVVWAADETDLIIVDHVHYFDIEDTDNENRAMKKIASTARTLALEHNVPIILVSHLRKRDKYNGDKVPGLDEFHGSSDLFKIATKVITFASGATVYGGKYETFFRIPKNRIDGGTTRFLASINFSAEKGEYEKEYSLGSSDLQKDCDFESIGEDFCPYWAKSRKRSAIYSVNSGHENNSQLGSQTNFETTYPVCSRNRMGKSSKSKTVI